MNRPKVSTLLLGIPGLLLAALLGAWAFGPDAWHEAVLGHLGLVPPPRERPPPAVEVVSAQAGDLELTVATVGTLTAFEAVRITPEVSGHIAAIHFDEGARVAAGDLLIELVDDEPRARLDSAEAALRDARLAFDRARRLRDSGAVSEAELDRLEAQFDAARAARDLAAAQLARHRLEAPFAGHMGLRQASPGALVTPGTGIATLYAIDPLQLRFSLSGRLLDALRPGLQVRARSDAFRGETFDGEIRRVAPEIDPATRQVTVEAILPNADGRLRPGLFVDVEVILGRRQDAVTVPEAALLRRGAASFVYVIGQDGRAVRRDVETGEKRWGRIELRSGVEAGERVVTAGLQRIGDGVRVRVVEHAAGPGNGVAAQGMGADR